MTESLDMELLAGKSVLGRLSEAEKRQLVRLKKFKLFLECRLRNLTSREASEIDGLSACELLLYIDSNYIVRNNELIRKT